MATMTQKRDAVNDSAAPLAQLHQISKSYPGVLANDAVDLTISAGNIHALLGENGAGKSTLVKVMYGLLQADSGHISWQGQPVSINSPAAARELGIALVFQHFSLFESLSVLENIALGMAVDANEALASKIVEVSTRYGLPLDPSRGVYSLSVGERQRIEIVRCLLQSPKLLIMDEPTSVLTPQEVNELFVTLRRLAEEGMAILYISHKLEEIRALCNEATILRGGKRIATAIPSEHSAASLASMMMGGDVATPNRRQKVVLDQPYFNLNNVSMLPDDPLGIKLHGVSLSLNAGEIVGIAGVAGNGQDELMQVISGERKTSPVESIVIKEKVSGQLSPGERRKIGLCCVPEERHGHAAVPGMSLNDNAFLTAHHRKNMKTLGMRSQRKSRQFTDAVIKQFNVHCNGSASFAGSLSGGNLQKFIVGREMMQSPDVLVISQPTWGVDAGAASAIHSAILELASQGAAVLLISQDLEELMLITDRIGALCAGRLSTFYPTETVSVQDVGILMGGAQLSEATA